MEPMRDFPTTITFHGVDRTPELDELVRRHIEQLPRFHPRIHGVTVVLTKDAARHESGDRYRVQVRVAIPGDDVVVSHHHGGRPQHEDPYITITDAFKTVERQLEEGLRIRRGFVKTHDDALAPGRIVRLPAGADHGFLETADGREVYFHRNSVIDAAFEELAVGARVRFAEEDGQKGPQASAVQVG